MNNSKNKNLNLLKFGQASLLLTSLVLPSIIATTTTNAKLKPFKPPVTSHNYIKQIHKATELYTLQNKVTLQKGYKQFPTI